ncbi:unnamed protein product, partial [Heterosigma akashiwo]
ARGFGGRPAAAAGAALLDWELADLPRDAEGRRLLRITLQKHVPLAGLTVWWSSMFKGDTEIDVAAIEGRGGGGAPAAHADAWAEAQRLFREKMRDRPP